MVNQPERVECFGDEYLFVGLQGYRAHNQGRLHYGQQNELLSQVVAQEVENAPAKEVPHEVFQSQIIIAVVAPVVAVDEVARPLSQEVPHHLVETESEDHSDPQEQNCEGETQLVAEVEAEGAAQVAEAHVDEVDHVALEKCLQQHCLDEVELADILAHFVLLDEEEEPTEDQTEDDVKGDHVDEEGKDSLQQD